MLLFGTSSILSKEVAAVKPTSYYHFSTAPSLRSMKGNKKDKELKMTIDKAIKKLKGLLVYGLDLDEQGIEDAVKLGIEALHLLKDERKSHGFWRHKRLPGETEE